MTAGFLLFDHAFGSINYRKTPKEGTNDMKNRKTNQWLISLLLFLAFAVWTILLGLVDVQTIGPRNTAVGFARLNGYIHRLTGVHFFLYEITDWLGLIPVFVGIGFALLGLWQWICRKSIRKVDQSLLILGGFYLLLAAVYLFFEKHIINYRPVLIDGYLEVSYPSSTTLLVLCVMPTAAMQLKARIQNNRIRKISSVTIPIFSFLMVIGRLISGVHWFSDIIGSILLSSSLVCLYGAVCKQAGKKAVLSSNLQNRSS